MGENMEAGTNAESDEKAGTKINKESDAKKSKKFRKEFLSQKQKDHLFFVAYRPLSFPVRRNVYQTC